MKSSLFTIFKYLFIISLTGVLIWLSLRGLKTDEDQNKVELLWQTWQQSNKNYLILMAVIAFASHWLRALRWKLLMEPTGHFVKQWSSFHSLMVGYLINLVIPRGGEISRSYNLYKLEKTPVETSFGTVVVERIVDLCCLLILLLISFGLEWNNLILFFEQVGIRKASASIAIPGWIWIVLVALSILAFFIFSFRKHERVKKIIDGFKDGLLAVLRLNKKGLFLFYSLIIWLLYFMMTYSVMLAFEQTSGLGIGAVLVVFAIGAIAMAIPLPGGLGSYHTLMPIGLVMIYQIPRTDAVSFVFVFHGWQTLVMILGGLVSLISTYIIIQRNGTSTKK